MAAAAAACCCRLSRHCFSIPSIPFKTHLDFDGCTKFSGGEKGWKSISLAAPAACRCHHRLVCLFLGHDAINLTSSVHHHISLSLSLFVLIDYS
jgi:hypothetical protein